VTTTVTGTLRLGTRRSALALAQSGLVAHSSTHSLSWQEPRSQSPSLMQGTGLHSPPVQIWSPPQSPSLLQGEDSHLPPTQSSPVMQSAMLEHP